MDKITEGQVQAALLIIVINRDVKAVDYAVNYANMGKYMEGHELYVQVLYVLGNITRWRGEVAKGVREVLKQYVKENK